MGYLRRKTLEWLPAIAVAIASAACSIGAGRFGTAIWKFEGLCRELVAGTTEGRQALVGSGWYPPLPLLAGTPAAACAPTSALPWAAIFTTALAVAISLYTLNRTLGRCISGQNRSARIARVAAWLACAATFAIAQEPLSTAITATGIVAVCKLADWWESGGLADLVKLAFAIAALALCGFATAGIVLALFILMPLPVFWKPSLKGRFHGVFVLGALPGIYAILVWCLMCWLILGDGLYPLRGFSSNISWAPHAMPAMVLLCFALLPIAAIILRRRDSMQCAVSAATLLSFAWILIGGFSGIGWSQTSCIGILLACTLLILARAAGQSPRDHGAIGPRVSRLGGIIQCAFAVLCLLVVGAVAKECARAYSNAPEHGRMQTENTSEELLEEIRADVAARTPYGRIFVCGYSGQALLRGARPEPFTPCLDPYIGELRRDYPRQQIFLLMPVPVGATRWESLYWRYPEIYYDGTQRLLFARDFGTPRKVFWGSSDDTRWRLYELVSAPSEDQLQEWREN